MFIAKTEKEPHEVSKPSTTTKLNQTKPKQTTIPYTVFFLITHTALNTAAFDSFTKTNTSTLYIHTNNFPH